MKYRDIAKEVMLKFGSNHTIVAADAANLTVVGGERDAFTPKQIDKSQAALAELTASLRKKWKMEDD